GRDEYRHGALHCLGAGPYRPVPPGQGGGGSAPGQELRTVIEGERAAIVAAYPAVRVPACATTPPRESLDGSWMVRRPATIIATRPALISMCPTASILPNSGIAPASGVNSAAQDRRSNGVPVTMKNARPNSTKPAMHMNCSKLNPNVSWGS